MNCANPNIPEVVACLDVGSPKSGNVGWAVLHCGEKKFGRHLPQFIDQLVLHLEMGRTAAIGFECPLYIPKRDDPMEMTSARLGEVGVNWCGGPGGSVLATGLVQVHWVLRHLAQRVFQLAASTRWQDFCYRNVQLFIWEAFITSTGGVTVSEGLPDKNAASDHERDAICGAMAFAALSKKQTAVTSDLRQEPAISLVGMHMLNTGLATDWGLLNETCVVLKVRKPT